MPFPIALLWAHPAALAQEEAARNVRLATYNAQMLPAPASTDGQYFDDDGLPLTNVERAKLLSQRILDSGLEIVALQEVFDEDARKVLVQELSPVYKHFVAYIGNDWDPSDSGLMLFSQHPFEKMELDDEHVYECGDVEIGQDGSFSQCSDGVLGFVEFDCKVADTQSDCFAAKGAGLVRITPRKGESMLVAFSHFRASYDDDPILGTIVGDPELIPCGKVTERQTALEQIGKLVADATDEVEGAPIDARVVLMGDLNIDANPFHDQDSVCLNAEWDDAFSSTSAVAFTGCADLDRPTCEAEERVMVDTWGFTTSVDDLGRTSSFPFTTDPSDAALVDQGERLDYVLVRGGMGPRSLDPMVPQHLTIAWPLAGRTGGMSDHLPVAVDLLLPGEAVEHSTPVEAATLTVPSNGGSASVSLEIEVPGQMQWTLVDGDPGTYTVQLSTTAVAMDLYEVTDLSRPIEPRREATGDRGGLVYVLPNPPYFVRTWAVVPGFREHDRTATPVYSLIAHEHQCKSPEEACVLTAGEVADPLKVDWPAGTAVNAQDAMFFEFYADDPDVQKTPTFHEFELGGDGSNPLTKFEFEVIDNETLATLPAVSWKDLVDTGDRLSRRADGVTGKVGSTPSFDDHLLRVTRQDVNWGGTTRVIHRTNLTYFTPGTIEVLQEDDASAHDELWLYIDPVPASQFYDTVDESNVHSHVNEFVSLPQIDEKEDGGSAWDAASLGDRRLTEELPLLMVEDDDEDGVFEEGDFLFAEPHPAAGLGTSSGRALAVLALDRTEAHGVWVFTDDTSVPDDDSDYRYRFVFDVSHTPPCFMNCN
ncbi:MAG: endonuclease/exonuclease/phosphatase family protein [Myxococcota bacterium]